MPIIKSAKKALRVGERRQGENILTASRMRTAVKSFMTAPTQAALSEAFSRIDRAVKNNLLHRNTAARRKARLSSLLK
jgi:small subunit ribosomal protein S20